MIVTHPALVLKSLYPSLTWNKKTDQKNLYLTFDDGPTPGVTDRLLDLLQDYQAKASFFCVGRNLEKNPDLFRRILDEGHEIGNHTYNHMNGWKSSNLDYLKNIQSFQKVYQSKFFRPPYGRLKPAQIAALKGQYQIIMWSALSMDYHSRVSKEKCYANANKQLKAGDILLFHDSLKAEKSMFYAVQRILEEKSKEGYVFASLSN